MEILALTAEIVMVWIDACPSEATIVITTFEKGLIAARIRIVIVGQEFEIDIDS